MAGGWCSRKIMLHTCTRADAHLALPFGSLWRTASGCCEEGVRSCGLCIAPSCVGRSETESYDYERSRGCGSDIILVILVASWN